MERWGWLVLGGLLGLVATASGLQARDEGGPGTAILQDGGVPETDGGPPAVVPAYRAPRPRTVYMGRRIAQTMHYEGAPWLIRDEREREERCSMVLANLGLRPGMMVCDMGCGNGFYSLPIARLVGRTGHVLAVDIQPEMLVMLRERMQEEAVPNITPILGSAWDPRLPSGVVDLVLLVDVYHEFSHPEEMLRAIRRSLAPGGVVVLLEYRAEDPKVPIKRVHKMSRRQVDREMEANGFVRVGSFDRLPWQHLLVYAVADERGAGPPPERDGDRLPEQACRWPERGSNPHEGYPSRDFKSRASASSAIRPVRAAAWASDYSPLQEVATAGRRIPCSAEAGSRP